MFKLEDFLPKQYAEHDTAFIGRIADYYRGRLRRTGYVERDDTAQAVSTAISHFATITAHRKTAKAPLPQPLPTKGIVLYGSYGTGKSMLLKRLSAMEDITCRDEMKRRVAGIEYISTMKIMQNYMVDGEKWMRDFFGLHRRDFLIIDEIGSERNVKRFGSESSMPDIIEDRYESFKDFGVTTIFATNIPNREELGRVYGERIKSRLVEMCEFVLFKGNDWRTETVESKSLREREALRRTGSFAKSGEGAES